MKKIVFFGIDGSGKTTLIKEISKELSKKGFETSYFYMGLGSEFNFPFIKQIMKISSWIKGRNKKSDKELRKYNYRQRSVFWVLGQYLELWLRYLKAKRVSKKKIVIFDRFFYDGLVLASPLAYKIFRHFTPSPELSFLIQAPAKVINKRKNEADIEDIKKYYLHANKLFEDFPIIRVDNSQNIKKVKKELLSYILNEKN